MSGAPAAGSHWKVRLGVPLGYFILRLLGMTWRIRFRNDEGLRRLVAEGKPWVFTLWHGQLLPVAWSHRDRGIVVLVSEHRDGEIITRVLERLGCGTVRGSTTRGGGRALIGLIRELSAGHAIAVTPDGPQGPAMHFQPGAIVAAQRAGAPVIALALHADRAWRLNSWDSFMIPKPFARLTVAYSAPTFVGDGGARDAAAEAPRFEALMRETQELARG
ncbi:MAG: lysophospholipid acyltransferase family protein [Gemmatimonadetes bacterium]|nr:lysophospholipid acyltransferase family protein [Gemmatimonadota bacterium]MBI3566881.1 lysophospholipid acyltransferase family protein [Gemmatimonadota bacterium]